MPLSAALLPEFDHEMANTRKTLERIPDGKFDWKPHQRSHTMGWLGGHISNLPLWSKMTIEKDSLDLAVAPPSLPEVNTSAALMAQFERNVADARAAIAAASDSDLMQLWSLKNGAQTILTMPRMSVLRLFVMNHLIHHRAQLTVYLRLNDIPVPALYGPSADES